MGSNPPGATDVQDAAVTPNGAMNPSDMAATLGQLGYTDKANVQTGEVSNVNFWDTLVRGGMGDVSDIKNNYQANFSMVNPLVDDKTELQQLQANEKDGLKGVSDEEKASMPWYAQASLDAENFGIGLLDNYAAGAAAGGVSALTAAPIAAATSRIPVVGPWAAGTVEAGAYGSGMTTGAIMSLTTQASGSMYRALRLAGHGREESRNVSMAYAALMGAIGYGGFHSMKALAGNAMTVAARQGLVKSMTQGAEQEAVAGVTPLVQQMQRKMLTRLGVSYAGAIGANTGVGEAGILLKHAALAAIAMHEKNLTAGAAMDWGSTIQDMRDHFLELLGSSFLLATGVAATGAVAGKAKTTVSNMLNDDTVNAAVKELHSTSPAEILQRIEAAATEKPFPGENETDKLAYNTEQQPVRLSEQAPLEGEVSQTQHPATLPVQTATGEEQYPVISDVSQFPEGKPSKQVQTQPGKCFSLAGQASMAGTGDYVLGAVRLGEGKETYHAVVENKAGYVFDPTFERWYTPDVYQQTTRFRRITQLTGDEVKNITDEQGNSVPPTPTKLGLPENPADVREGQSPAAEILAPHIGATPEEVQAGLDTLFPAEDAGTLQDLTDKQGKVIQAQDAGTPLTPEETQARINQIAADQRLLSIEQRKLEADFKVRDKTGKGTSMVLQRLENVINAQEALQTERELLEYKMLTREDIGSSWGKMRISKLGKLMDELQKRGDRLIKTKDHLEQKVLTESDKAYAKGKTAEQRTIRILQNQVGQYIHALTPDTLARQQLKALVLGATTKSQLDTATAKVKQKLGDLVAKQAEDQEKQDRQKVVAALDRLIAQAKPKMSGGKPTSLLTADAVKQINLLKGFIQNGPAADAAITTFNSTPIHDPMYPYLKTYLDAVLNGQSHLIPDADMMVFKAASLAEGFKNKDSQEIQIIADNVSQWLQDAKDEVQQVKAARVAQRKDELQTMFDSADIQPDKIPQGNVSTFRHIRQHTETAGAAIMTFPALMKYITPKDTSHTLAELMDPTQAKREFLANDRNETFKFRRHLQTYLGPKENMNKYLLDTSTDEFKFQFLNQKGKMEFIELTRAQAIDAYMKIQDPTLHAMMRDTTTGNGWTLRGDVTAGLSFDEVVTSILTHQDIAVAHGLLTFYQGYHPRINAAFRSEFGADLPFNPNYSPLEVEGHEVEPGTTDRGAQFAQMVPASARSRVTHLNRVKLRNPVMVAEAHITDWEHWMAFKDFLGTYRNIFFNPIVIRHLTYEHGSGTVDVIHKYFQRFVMNNPMPTDAKYWFLSAFRSDMSYAALGFRPFYQVCQHMTSGIAMWGEHSPIELAAGVARMIAHPAATEAAFRASPILRDRFEGNVDFDLKTALNQAGMLPATLERFTGLNTGIHTPKAQQGLMRLAFEGIKYGDAGAARMFGGPVYWAEIARGKTSTQAMMTVERLVESTRQSSGVDQMPDIYATNPLAYALFGQFHLQPLQLMDHSMIALRDYVQAAQDAGKDPKKQLAAFGTFGKQMMVTWALPGLFYGALQNAPSLINPQSDNQDVRDQAILSIASESVLGTLRGYPLAGDMIEAAWFASAKPLFGVDLNFKAHVSGNNIVEAFYDSPVQAMQLWQSVWKQENTVKLPTLSTLGKDPLDTEIKALIKTARTIGPIARLPASAINAPLGAADAMDHEDLLGAAFAMAGWSPGSVLPRWKETKPLQLPRLGQQQQEPLMPMDQFHLGAIEAGGSDQSNPDELEKAYLNGMMEHKDEVAP